MNDEIMQAARRMGAELIGHVAEVLADRGHDRNLIADRLGDLDADLWWEEEGGPLADRLAELLGLGDDEDEGLDLQALIDSGMAWRLEGAVGRAAADAIEAGACVLGPTGHRDYWGTYVPSRDEVKPGTKGSVEYARERGWEGEVG